MSSERNIKSTNMCLVGDSKTAEVDGKERPLKYEGTTGVKTGFTEDAGYCFCGAAKERYRADRRDAECGKICAALYRYYSVMGLRVF